VQLPQSFAFLGQESAVFCRLRRSDGAALRLIAVVKSTASKVISPVSNLFRKGIYRVEPQPNFAGSELKLPPRLTDAIAYK
jgi:hypothetical protein